jgi:large subunit ribosomal protein L15
MELSNLTKLVDKSLKRVGRGHGSGRGKTSGRGTKGQKARRDIKLNFEGGALALTKRMPFLKGMGRNKRINRKSATINLEDLNTFAAGSIVDVDALVKKGLIDGGKVVLSGVKLLARGDIKVALTVKIPVSKQAQIKIEKAKGTVELN